MFCKKPLVSHLKLFELVVDKFKFKKTDPVENYFLSKIAEGFVVAEIC